MTLPDSENRRINLDYTTPLFRQVAGMEASLWYERMGKFAEMQGEIIIGHRSFSFDGPVWVEFYTNPLIKLTTPELINEFLKIK